MQKFLLVTGGARSGKSLIAETRCLDMGRPAGYIATAQAWDDEMRARIAEHQARRGPEWLTYTEPMDLLGALRASDGRGPRLVDCLTLWLTNMMLAEADWQSAAQAMLAELPQHKSPVVFVTNEVGLGIVPDNALARALAITASASAVFAAISASAFAIRVSASFCALALAF